jgi:hypothetical protein
MLKTQMAEPGNLSAFRNILAAARFARAVVAAWRNRPRFALQLSLMDLIDGPPVPAAPEQCPPSRRWCVVEPNGDIRVPDPPNQYVRINVVNVGAKAGQIRRVGGQDANDRRFTLRHNVPMPATIQPEASLAFHVQRPEVVRHDDARWPWKEIHVEDDRGTLHRCRRRELERVTRAVCDSHDDS